MIFSKVDNKTIEVNLNDSPQRWSRVC